MCKDNLNDLFALKAPCKNCPFRSDKAFPPLGKKRIEGIINDIRDKDGFFPCHKTTKTDYDDEGEGIKVSGGVWCAGALAMLRETETTNNHWQLRLAQAQKRYIPSNIKTTHAPVFRTWEDLIKYHTH